jgi:hypothetical protein
MPADEMRFLRLGAIRLDGRTPKRTSKNGSSLRDGVVVPGLFGLLNGLAADARLAVRRDRSRTLVVGRRGDPIQRWPKIVRQFGLWSRIASLAN